MTLSTELTPSSDATERTARRARELFDQEQTDLARSTDRLFAYLMAGQWLAAIFAAFMVSPLAWEGSTQATYVHVYAAVVLGGLITALPVVLALWQPGVPRTRYMVAGGQMLMSALFIHLCGGRIETHFHVFGSLAFLACYRDWKVLAVGSVVITLDHFLRGMWWPQSVYGEPYASPWQTVEYAGWVLFENCFLVATIDRSLEATRAMCLGRAQVEVSHEQVERQVGERTREVHTSEERFRSLCNASPIGILETDASGRCVYANPSWEKLSGLTSEQSLGEGWTQAIDAANRDEVVRSWHEAAGEGRASSVEFQVHTPAGLTHWVHWSSAPIRDADGVLSGHVGTIEDIEERKRSEDTLIRAREAALETARLKSEFLANMSHEIRTPLNGVVGMTELTLDTELNPEQREYLETARESAEGLRTVIDDILDFSKIEAGKLDLDPIPFDLRESLSHTLRTLAVRATQKGLELVWDVDEEVPANVIGDPGRLRQIVINLVGNAIKFTEKGEVVLRVTRELGPESDAPLHFSVSDTGVGIPEDKQDLIFQAFAQADGSTTRTHGGTGLGLAITMRLAELMGGRIWVESEPGKGSTFHFTVRLTRALEQPAPPKAENDLKGCRALIVDDNAASRRYLERVLGRYHMKIGQADSGAKALEAIRSAALAGEPHRLVLVDGQMPGMDGFTLVERIRKEPEYASLALVLLTSAGVRGDAARCRELGMSGYLTKPVSEADLVEAVRQVLAPAEEKAKPALVTRHSLREGRKRLRVLVAEDNEINRRVAIRMLEKRGHRVESVGDGEAAVEAVRKRRFDVVLMDVQMPKLSGLEAAKRIRAHEQGTDTHVRIVALTARALKGDEEQCIAAGMDAYVSKPLRAAELFASLEGLPSVAGSTTEEPEVAVLDPDELIDRCGDDLDLAREMIHLFRLQAPELVLKLSEAVERRKPKEIELAAHAIHGALATLAAKASAAAARRIEEMGRQGQSDAAAALQQLENELARLDASFDTAFPGDHEGDSLAA